ncbi:MAG: neutral/alkaline non-lysosomal ceramidase N-terminal domain-containing protein [Chitinophagaceae bacterium]|nr:neutral/alkaline non-lysosomal ceramidase N-terminal domain-containing protein [Chitinophagaceae bacterium]
MIRKLNILVCFLITNTFCYGFDDGWKAGVAKIRITPKQHMWMAGYASRTAPSNGTYDDLWAKALVLRDGQGKQVVLITLDLLGVTKAVSDTIKNKLGVRFNLSKADILINSSHTHSGPVLKDALKSIYNIDEREKVFINNYTNELIRKVFEVVDKAFHNMKPVSIFVENGITRFQVNRRNNKEAELTAQTILKGPNDYSVPVIKVENRKGSILAIAFGYACHATVLNENKWSGDYPGYAQTELEKKHKGASALFFQGAGGNLNPLPRRTVQLAKQYGSELAAAVERVLNEKMKPISGSIATAYNEINLQFSNPSLPHYPYPVQIWKLGEQPVVALGGELLVEYSVKLKQLLTREIFVLGYSNDVMAYIPSVTVLKEGGYEGSGSQKVYGMPADWSERIESDIISEVLRLARSLNIPVQKN